MHPLSKSTVVRLLNDGPMAWPVWFGNEVADDRERQPISPVLEAELVSWNRFYREHNDEGWGSDESALRYNELGRAVARRVRDELGPLARVLLLIERSSAEPMGWVEITSVD
jgi:hypothetical protein